MGFLCTAKNRVEALKQIFFKLLEKFADFPAINKSYPLQPFVTTNY
jgi:hypothetical protein